MRDLEELNLHIALGEIERSDGQNKYPNPKNETRKTKKNQIQITGACCSSSSLSSVVLDSDKPSIKDNSTSLSLSHNVEFVGVVGSMIADLSLDLLWIG